MVLVFTVYELIFFCLCSEPDNVQLVEGSSRCTGRLEMKLQGNWKQVDAENGDLKSAALVCAHLKCGPAVSVESKPSAARSVWGLIASRVQAGFALRECVSTRPWHARSSLEITCLGNTFSGISHDANTLVFITATASGFTRSRTRVIIVSN